MDFTGRIYDVSMDYKTKRPIIQFVINENPNGIEDLDNKDLKIKVTKVTKPRSLDANAYFHVLCDKLRQKLTVAILMLGIFLRIVTSYSKGETKTTIVCIMGLIILGIVYSLIKIVLGSIQALSELPVMGTMDKILGGVLGALVAIIIFHIVVAASEMGYLGHIGRVINEDVANDNLLQSLRKLDLIELVISWKDQIFNSIK